MGIAIVFLFFFGREKQTNKKKRVLKVCIFKKKQIHLRKSYPKADMQYFVPLVGK